VEEMRDDAFCLLVSEGTNLAGGMGEVFEWWGDDVHRMDYVIYIMNWERYLYNW
jgi:hypothetical protein